MKVTQTSIRQTEQTKTNPSRPAFAFGGAGEQQHYHVGTLLWLQVPTMSGYNDLEIARRMQAEEEGSDMNFFFFFFFFAADFLCVSAVFCRLSLGAQTLT